MADGHVTDPILVIVSVIVIAVIAALVGAPIYLVCHDGVTHLFTNVQLVTLTLYKFNLFIYRCSTAENVVALLQRNC